MTAIMKITQNKNVKTIKTNPYQALPNAAVSGSNVKL